MHDTAPTFIKTDTTDVVGSDGPSTRRGGRLIKSLARSCIISNQPPAAAAREGPNWKDGNRPRVVVGPFRPAHRPAERCLRPGSWESARSRRRRPVRRRHDELANRAGPAAAKSTPRAIYSDLGLVRPLRETETETESEERATGVKEISRDPSFVRDSLAILRPASSSRSRAVLIMLEHDRLS